MVGSRFYLPVMTDDMQAMGKRQQDLRDQRLLSINSTTAEEGETKALGTESFSIITDHVEMVG